MVERNLGEQAGDDAQGVGDGSLAAAAFQVVIESYEGSKAVAALGDVPDEGLGLGRGAALGDVAGTHWWEKSSARGRSRNTASSWAYLRWRASTCRLSWDRVYMVLPPWVEWGRGEKN